MATETQDPRALLAKMDEEVKAAKEKAEKLEKDNEAKRKEILSKLRKEDLEDVRNKCKMHGFTATELRGYLKTKGGGSKAAGTKSVAKKTTGRGKKQSA